MGQVTIYRFSAYDIRSDELVVSKRWGTRDAIAKIGGQIDEASRFETDEASIASDVSGLTDVGFSPPAYVNFPTLEELVVAQRDTL